MTNLESSPQLLIPSIPETDCPTGTLPQLFDYYFQKYIGQATISIDGLGDVTPAQIQAMDDRITTLQNQVDAFEINVRHGTAALPSGPCDVQITFATAMPNTNYSLTIEIVDSTGIGASVYTWMIWANTKLTTGVKIRFTGSTSTATSFNYCVRQYPA